MHNRARGCDGLRHLPAAKSVKRFDLEVFTQRKDCLFGEKRVAVVAKRIRDFLELLLLLVADEKLRRRNARKFVQQRLSATSSSSSSRKSRIRLATTATRIRDFLELLLLLV